jgi:hypothetical protein
MKKLILLFVIFAVNITNAQTNQIIFTGSGGLHSTVTKIYGANPILNENTQFAKTPVAAARIYKTGKRTHGIWLGLSGSADAMKIKYTYPNTIGSIKGSTYTGGTMKRFEFGYHFISKKIFFNNLLSESNQNDKGFFTQIQPIAGVAYLTSNYSGNGSSSGGDVSFNNTNTPKRNLGVVYGMNFYFGKNNKTWFFINVQHNINFTESTSKGIFTYTNNGITTINKVETNGSGFAFNGGLVLYKFKYK